MEPRRALSYDDRAIEDELTAQQVVQALLTKQPILALFVEEASLIAALNSSVDRSVKERLEKLITALLAARTASSPAANPIEFSSYLRSSAILVQLSEANDQGFQVMIEAFRALSAAVDKVIPINGYHMRTETPNVDGRQAQLLQAVEKASNGDSSDIFNFVSVALTHQTPLLLVHGFNRRVKSAAALPSKRSLQTPAPPEYALFPSHRRALLKRAIAQTAAKEMVGVFFDGLCALYPELAKPLSNGAAAETRQRIAQHLATFPALLAL